jgi:gluconate 2-dehydrogenase subunit 3-like protein
MSLDRRTTIKWMFAAAATVPSLRAHGYAPEPLARDVAANQAGYGTDPELLKEWRPGGPWPLTLGVQARLTTAALCDLIIPADEHSPAASAVGVMDFIDEWISAPYPQQRGDRDIVLQGLVWIEAEAQRRFGKALAALDESQKNAIADDICAPASARPEFATAAKFFARFRDLTAGGFYTTPVGMKDIGYTGNVPLEKFDGPPLAALKKAGLA